MKVLAYILLLILFVLHQDFWLWTDRSIVLQFLPVGMAYHVGYTLVTAGLWVFVIKALWPSHLERWAEDEA